MLHYTSLKVFKVTAQCLIKFLEILFLLLYIRPNVVNIKKKALIPLRALLELRDLDSLPK